MKKVILLYLCMASMALSVVNAQEKKGKMVYPSFLSIDDIPDGTRYLPAPPDTSSVAFLMDFSRYQWGKSMRDSERGRQAVRDSYYEVDSIMKGFAPAFGILVTRETAPEISRLIDCVTTDAGNSVRKAKKKYMRKRPYVQFNEPTAIPKDEEPLRHSGSFPSGHSATGWGIALILTEINPQNQEQILQRGYEFGQSRVIAGYHYQSDVDVARIAASAAIARLHADAGFQKQMEKAKKEFQRLMGK